LARTRFVCRQHGDTALKKKPTDAKDQCQKGFADAKDQLRQVKGTQDVLRKNPGADLGFLGPPGLKLGPAVELKNIFKPFRYILIDLCN
jgi:hypothetical protein